MEWLLLLPLCLLCLVTALNALSWPRMKPGVGGSITPDALSVLIPARNEARNLPQTLQAWVECPHPRLEILVLDDHSQDDTAAIVQSFARRDARIRLLSGKDLPQGWAGKNWACWQLAQEASAEFLLFTDADVRWAPEAPSLALAYLLGTQASLLALWPAQVTLSLAERLVVPLIALAVMFYLPVPAAHHLPFASMSAAIGQALLFRRGDYFSIGGHAALGPNPLDDITLAQNIKRAGLRLRLLLANGLVTCRMYTSWPEVRDGIARSLLGSSGGRLWPLFALVLLQVWLFVFPYVWLAWAMFGGGALLAPMLAVLAGLCARLLAALAHQQRWQEALLMPLSVLLLLVIALRAAWWKVKHGGALWKGRVV